MADEKLIEENKPHRQNLDIAEKDLLKASSLFSVKHWSAQQDDLSRNAGKGFKIRAFACLIDIALILFFSIMFISLAASWRGYVFPEFGVFPEALPQKSLFEIDMLRGNIIAIVYFSIFEWLFGATPGKLILRMRVVKLDGGQLGLLSVILRGVLRVVDGAFFGIPAFFAMTNLRQQRIGDKAAGTMVVGHSDAISFSNSKPIAGFFLASGFSLVLLLVCGFWFVNDRMDAVTRSDTITASGINLASSDLDDQYSLIYEAGKGEFPPEKTITDINERLFQTGDYQITSTIAIYSDVLYDSYYEIMPMLIQDAKQNPDNKDLMFFTGEELAIGDQSGIVRFLRESTNEEGCILFVVRRNVFIQLVGYGSENTNHVDELVNLAKIMEKRIH